MFQSVYYPYRVYMATEPSFLPRFVVNQTTLHVNISLQPNNENSIYTCLLTVSRHENSTRKTTTTKKWHNAVGPN
jgi:hypothetical protein